MSYPSSFPVGHPLYTYEPIPECDAGYYINHEGKVWSEKRKRFKKLQENNGYLQFMCYPSKKNIYIHRAVAKVFLGDPDPSIKDPQVNHKNHLKDDNNADNLEWMSASLNNSNHQKTDTHTSKYIGVSYDKNAKKWRWEVPHNGKPITKYCDTEEQAKKERNEYIMKHNLDLVLND